MRKISVRGRGLMCVPGRVSEAAEAGQGRSPQGRERGPARNGVSCGGAVFTGLPRRTRILESTNATTYIGRGKQSRFEYM